MIRPLLCAVAAALWLPGTALGAQEPVAGAADARIRFVDYDATDVVELHAYYGYEIHITFGDGERIGQGQVILGDTAAWTESHAGNSLFIKPKDDNATTNMTVVTDRHSYEFSLRASEPPEHQNPKRISFVVAYRYPADDAHTNALADSQEQERIDIAAQLAAAKNTHPHNLNYYAQGSADVIPNKAWDDQMFTYLQYVGGREMPAVFVVNADGSESLINSHIDHDTIVVHQLAAHLVVRKGGSVACIFNKSYDSALGGSASGTVAPGISRKVKGQNP